MYVNDLVNLYGDDSLKNDQKDDQKLIKAPSKPNWKLEDIDKVYLNKKRFQKEENIPAALNNTIASSVSTPSTNISNKINQTNNIDNYQSQNLEYSTNV